MEFQKTYNLFLAITCIGLLSSCGETKTIFENNKGEAETIAGFVLEISGSFPKRNSKITFENYVFTIEAIDKKRIKRLKVTIGI